MEINKHIDVNTTADKAWAVISDLGNIDQWSSMVYYSECTQNAEGGARVSETSMGKMTENILTFDADNMIISYDAKGDKMPFFVKHLENNWKIKTINTNNCRIIMKAKANIMKPFNIFPGPMMKMQLSKALDGMIKELKHYLETGEVAQSKVKANEKLKKKTA